MIPTAEDFIRKEYNFEREDVSEINAEGHHAIWMMQEFAKLHVKAALEQAYNNSSIERSKKKLDDYDYADESHYQVSKESILTAYPDGLIK